MGDRQTTLERVLEVENNPGLLEHLCPGTDIPLWAMIRWDALMSLVAAEQNAAKSVVDLKNSRHLGGLSLAPSLAKAALRNRRRLGKLSAGRSIVLIGDSPVRMTLVNGRAFNTETDHFYGEDPSLSLVLEEIASGAHPRVHEDVLAQTPYRAIPALQGRATQRRVSAAAKEVIATVDAAAQDVLGIRLGDTERQKLVHRCARRGASVERYFSTYQSLLKRLECRLLIKNAASYGGPENAAVVSAARELGITVAENQHGVIFRTHLAYNYSDAVRNSALYRQVLPDHLLLYGDWWGTQTNAPISHVAIGHPHRSEMSADWSRADGDRRTVLVLGDGVDTQATVDLCERLGVTLGPGYRVLLRPHPKERAVIAESGLIQPFGSVTVDDNLDIYDSFREAHAVVGERSTGLFEAIGLVPKILRWRSPDRPELASFSVFDECGDAQELVEKISAPGAEWLNQTRGEPFWAAGWKSNYRTFVSGVMGGDAGWA